MKLCQIYNNAAHYRESIFLLMDKTFDCDYVFGESLGDVKQMDTSKFRGSVTKVKNRFFRKGFYWQPGVQKLLGKGYDAYIILGDTRCLSTWWFCLRAKLTGRSKRIYFWAHERYGRETVMEKWLKKRFFQLNKLIRYQFINDIVGQIIRSEWRNLNHILLEVIGGYANLAIEFAHKVAAERRVMA